MKGEKYSRKQAIKNAPVVSARKPGAGKSPVIF